MEAALRATRGSILIENQDDGRGISDEGSRGISPAVLGIQARAKLLGGNSMVEPGRHKGTVVSVSLPSSPAQAAQEPT